LVCGRVDGNSDPLPDDLFDEAKFLLTDSRHKEELHACPTYDTAARCLLETIKEKNEIIQKATSKITRSTNLMSSRPPSMRIPLRPASRFWRRR
jgi:hypothetical protein